MLFENGFLGTSAPLYLDITTLYFISIPFLLLYSISYAKNKEYKKHYLSQFIILFVTFIVIVFFEVGIRITGGFAEYARISSINYKFLLVFLIIHIIIALCTLIFWFYFIFTSYFNYKKSIKMKNHKKHAIYLFLSICITSFMGLCLYIFLFIF